MRGRYSKKDWPKLVKEFRRGELTRREFSMANDISMAALDYHLRRKVVVANPRRGFIAVSPEATSGGEIILELPVGIKLTIRR